MDKRIRAIAAALGLTLGGLCWLSAPAAAAPAALGPGAVKNAASEATAAEQIRWVRSCWWDRRGFRHCRRFWRQGAFYGAPYRAPRAALYWGGPRRAWSGRFYGPRAFGGEPRAFRGSGVRGSGFRASGSGSRAFRGGMGGGGMGGGRMGGRR